MGHRDVLPARPRARRAPPSCSRSWPPPRASQGSSPWSRRPGRGASRSSRSCSARPRRTSPTACSSRPRSASSCSGAASPAAGTARGRRRSGCSRSPCVGHLLKERDVVDAIVERRAVRAAVVEARRLQRRGRPERPAARAGGRACGRSPGSTPTASPRPTCTPRCAAGRFAFDDTFRNVTLGLVGSRSEQRSWPLRARADDQPRERGDRSAPPTSSGSRCARATAPSARSRGRSPRRAPAGRAPRQRLARLLRAAPRQGRTSSTASAPRSSPTAPSGGVALVSGDPVGEPAAAPALLRRLRAVLPPRTPGASRRSASRAPTSADCARRSACARSTSATRRSSHPRTLLARGPRRSARCASRSRAWSKAGLHGGIVRAARADARAAARASMRVSQLVAGRPAGARLLDGARRPAARPSTATPCSRSATRPDGRLVGFVHFVPVPAPGDLSLSAMRRLPGHAQRPDGVPAVRDVRVGRRARHRARLAELQRLRRAAAQRRRAAGLGARLRRARSRAPTASSRSSACSTSTASSSRSGSRATPPSSSYSDLPLAALVLLSIESLVAWPSVLRRLWPHASPVPARRPPTAPSSSRLPAPSDARRTL